jgi:transcriptional regulator with XRE-family HTH domain
MPDGTKVIVEFDGGRLHADLEAISAHRKMSLREMADAIGVSASTLSRLRGGGSNPDVDSLAAILHWSHLRFDTYVRVIAAPAPPEPTILPGPDAGGGGDDVAG